MAGDDGPGRTKWTNIYGDDPNKYKGFSKYYNTETPFGRAWTAIINFSAVIALGTAFYIYKKSKSKSKTE